MSYTMTVSPDFPPGQIAEWYILNTWLQKQLGTQIHLELFDSFDAQRKAIEAGKIDLIYANPFDASSLVREQGFTAVAKPKNKADEVVIAVAADSDINELDDFQPGLRVASTDDPEVNMIGMIMLEPADLDAENTLSEVVDSYALVAKQIISDQADVGFFLAESYALFSSFLKNQLKVLVSSQISVISHAFMVSPAADAHLDAIRSALLDMEADSKTSDILSALGFDGWQEQSIEDTEFMIDLMGTLAKGARQV